MIKYGILYGKPHAATYSNWSFKGRITPRGQRILDIANEVGYDFLDISGSPFKSKYAGSAFQAKTSSLLRKS